MEVKEESDDEMILVVVGDEGITIGKYECSPEPEMLVPKTEIIEPEDEKVIYPTAMNLEESHNKYEVLDDEDLEDHMKKFTQEVFSLNKRSRRKARHKYLLEDEDFNVSAKNNKKKTKNSLKNKKRKKNVLPKPKKPKDTIQKNVQNVQRKTKHGPVTDEQGFLEIEFLEDDIKVSEKFPVSNDHFTEVEFLNAPKKIKEELVSTEEDEEYIPEEEDNQEEEYEDNLTDEEYLQPKEKTKPKTPSRRPGQMTPKVQAKKEERPIKSFIMELKKEQPRLRENKEELVEYLVDYMRKRRPPPPPLDYYHLDDNNMYSCSYCEKKVPTEAAASRHYQAAHGPRYLVCLACGSGYRSTVILYKHEKRCKGPGAAIQLRARGVFLGRKGRSRPYLTKNKFIPKELPPGKPKRVHIPYAQKTKYYCSDCPAHFSREILLDEHMHKHTGFRAFQCEQCPAAYVSRYQLTKHYKKHSDEQFICDHCGRVFKLKTTLSLHMDTHLPRPRFGCGRCGRRYAKRAAVRSHIMREHMNLPPPDACPVCPKRYNRISHVKVHMKRDHGLIMMTKRAIERNIPYMKVEDLEGAKIVFNKNENLEVFDLNPILNKQILQ